jgi:BirA family biotin operon repressor/biotin-[acetyl-CoA-carboxylase] ligase
MNPTDDFNQEKLTAALADLPLGGIHYFPRVDSTNAAAAALSDRGAADLTVVAAEEQTAGRGRQGRAWITRPGAALAVSVLLRPPSAAVGLQRLHTPGRYSGLGALAAVETVRDLYRFPAQVKWPNDILMDRLKVGGVLVEASWEGEKLSQVILGIGLNVREGALPDGAALRYPAGTIAETVGREINRLDLLRGLLEHLLLWRSRLASGAFQHAWERALAFRGQQVILIGENQSEVEGILIGLAADGSLKLQTGPRQIEEFPVGEIRLRPVDRSLK